MTCLDCDGETKVVDTVPYDGVVFRRRKCVKCGLSFGTMEDVCDKKFNRKFKEAFVDKKNRSIKKNENKL